MDKVPQSKHPLAAVHPRAFRACVSCRRLRRRCVWGAVIALVALLASPIMYGLGVATGLTSSPGLADSILRAVGRVVVLLFFGSLLGVLFSTLARLAIIAFFFTRYSLAHLLGVVLFIGACGTGIVKLSGVWMLFPIAGLCTLLVLILTYVGDQDPEGRSHTPAFLRKALERQESAKKESSKPQINADEHR